MAKIKPIKEIINRYAESALISAIRLRRHWISQGFSEKEAIERAVKQASGMMAASGVSLKELYELFGELEKACSVFKKMIVKAEQEIGKKKK